MLAHSAHLSYHCTVCAIASCVFTASPHWVLEEASQHVCCCKDARVSTPMELLSCPTALPLRGFLGIAPPQPGDEQPRLDAAQITWRALVLLRAVPFFVGLPGSPLSSSRHCFPAHGTVINGVKAPGLLRPLYEYYCCCCCNELVVAAAALSASGHATYVWHVEWAITIIITNLLVGGGFLYPHIHMQQLRGTAQLPLPLIMHFLAASMCVSTSSQNCIVLTMYVLIYSRIWRLARTPILSYVFCMCSLCAVFALLLLLRASLHPTLFARIAGGGGGVCGGVWDGSSHPAPARPPS